MDKYIAQNVEDIVPIVEKYGVAILENVLSPEECAATLAKTWDFFEELHPVIKRDDPSTWRYIYDLKPLHGMLFQHWGIGHAQYIWDLRNNPKIIRIFQVIWDCIIKTKYPGRQENTQDLKVSFDGASFGIPPEETNRGWHTKDWFHIDQRFIPSLSLSPSPLFNGENNNMQCIQSWVTTEDVGPEDGTLSVLEGSNRLHSQVGPLIYQNASSKVKDKLYKDDWYKFSNDELTAYYRDCPRVNIECRAGSMVFWDSRTVHCGRGPIRKRKEPRFRNVIYLCYMPAFMISDKMQVKRRKAYEALRTTSHWPNKVKLFSKMPRVYANDSIKPELKFHKKMVPVLEDEKLI